MPVSEKIIVFGGEVGGNRNNTTSTITSRNIMILPPHIRWIIGPVCVWTIHVWIIHTMKSHKINIINTTINILGCKVGGPSTQTTFTISITNTKWKITISIILISTSKYDDMVAGVRIFQDELKPASCLSLTKKWGIREMILPPNILWRIGPVFVWMNHAWILTTII